MRRKKEWVLSEKSLHDEIKREAKVLGRHAGAAEIIADRVCEKIMTWAKKRSAITERDLYDRVAKEIRKYDEDLAYLFETKDKVI